MFYMAMSSKMTATTKSLTISWHVSFRCISCTTVLPYSELNYNPQFIMCTQ